MEFDLDYEVRLATESAYKSLYRWSLQEFSKDGKQVGRDQIPWIWTLYFTASEFRYGRSIKMERELESENEGEREQSTEALSGELAEELEEEEAQHASYCVSQDTESITAKMQPGTVTRDGRTDGDATFSMFGSDREIQDFALRILKLGDDQARERCSVWGCVRYTSEVDFRNYTEQDCIEVHIWLTPKRFGELRQMLVTDGATLVQMSMKGVSGFYSDWSPSISTDEVKVLTSGDEHAVLIPEGCEISPPRLGTVSEFDLSVIHSHEFDSANRAEMSTSDAVEDEDQTDLFGSDADEDKATATRQQQDRRVPESPQMRIVSSQLLQAEQVLRSLRIPLWMIVILLVLLLFR